MAVCNGIKQISYRKKRHTQNSTAEVKIMTRVISAVHKRKPRETLAGMCKANDNQTSCAKQCRNEEAAALLANSNKEPKNRIETGRSATVAFKAVAFMADLCKVFSQLESADCHL